MDIVFCVDASHEAIVKHCVPDIFNTDQDAQYTSTEFINMLKSYGTMISRVSDFGFTNGGAGYIFYSEVPAPTIAASLS